MFRGIRWDGDPNHYRPTYAGDQRDERYPNVRWLDQGGLVHQSSAHCNLTLCENTKQFRELMHWVVVAPTHARVTCVQCMSNPEWLRYPIDEGVYDDRDKRNRRL